jgi:hypothetical protein
VIKKAGIGCLAIIGAIVVLGVIGLALGGSRSDEAKLVATAAPAREVANPTPATGAPAGAITGAATAATAAPAEAPTEAPTDAPPTVAAPQEYKVGDVVQLGDVALAVLGWDTPASTQFAKPEDGNKFVGVELMLANQGDTSANLSTLAQMSLKDGQDHRYTIDLLASTAMDGASPEGELVPGERLRGWVGFQVPSDASGLTFVFDSGLFKNGKVFIDLGDQPATVEPPAALATAAQLPTQPLGQPITAGDVTLTVNGVSTPEGTQFAKAAPGRHFVVVDVSLTNTGSAAEHLSTVLQMQLKDSLGRQYRVDLMAATVAGGGAPEGELAPGETVRGPVGFEVPDDIGQLLFVFDGNVFGTGKVFVQLP